MAEKVHAYTVTEIMCCYDDYAEDVKAVLAELTGEQFSLHGENRILSIVFLGKLSHARKEYYHTLAQGILRGIRHERMKI